MSISYYLKAFVMLACNIILLCSRLRSNTP